MPLDPQTIRDRMIRSYTAGYRRAGIAMTDREIERQVVSDCEIVDAARARGEISNGPRPGASPEPPKPRVDHVAQAAAIAGLRLNAGGGEVLRTRVLHGDPTKVSERWGYAAGRIKRILEGVRRDTTSLVVAVEDAELGKLATEFGELWSCFKTFTGPPPKTGPDRNPFRGLSVRDAARKFQRLVEDICDRSTGIPGLGPWYTGPGVAPRREARRR
jgi:hypothetical protein